MLIKNTHIRTNFTLPLAFYEEYELFSYIRSDADALFFPFA